MSSGCGSRPTCGLRHRLLLPILLSACATKPYERPTLGEAESALYRSDLPTSEGNLAQVPWQELFTDPVLRALIADGLARNLDLKVARTRIAVAEANLAQSRAAFAPTLQLDAQYGTSKQRAGALAFPRITLAQVSASSSWELDLWGKFRAAKRAAQAALEESWAYRRAVQTQLVADIANTYYALLALDREREITEETLAIRIADVEAVKALKEGAVVTGADVVQSEANRYAAEVALPDIRNDIRQAENALSVLLARPPQEIRRSSIDQQAVWTVLPLGVPAELLGNRPDVQQAEQAFRSAFELTNVGRTFFYPALTISGSAGFAAEELDRLFRPGSFIGGILAGLTQPILNRGVNRQRLRVAKAEQEAALLRFRQTLLVAGQEVSNALYAFQTAGEKAEARQHQLEALSKAVEYTKELLRYTSNTNYIDVLTSEQSLLAARISAVNDRLQQLQAVVALYRALGGGWR